MLAARPAAHDNPQTRRSPGRFSSTEQAPTSELPVASPMKVMNSAIDEPQGALLASPMSLSGVTPSMIQAAMPATAAATATASTASVFLLLNVSIAHLYFRKYTDGCVP